MSLNQSENCKSVYRQLNSGDRNGLDYSSVSFPGALLGQIYEKLGRDATLKDIELLVTANIIVGNPVGTIEY